MTTAKLRNVGASVCARLLDLARKSGDEFNLVLTRYGLDPPAVPPGVHAQGAVRAEGGCSSPSGLVHPTV